MEHLCNTCSKGCKQLIPGRVTAECHNYFPRPLPSTEDIYQAHEAITTKGRAAPIENVFIPAIPQPSREALEWAQQCLAIAIMDMPNMTRVNQLKEVAAFLRALAEVKS